MSVTRENFYSLPIVDVRPEDGDAVCLGFAVPQALRETFLFKPGQYLTLRTTIDGQDVRRCYSICSGLDEPNLQVGIKHLPDGVFSSYARMLHSGDTLQVLPPRGEFHTPLAPEHHKRYLCICAGSGITPVLSIVKSILKMEPHSQITLIYGNRTSTHIMFRETLCFLKNRYLERLQWINILSREIQEAEVLYGHINNRKGTELQSRHLISISDYDVYFLCGPASMVAEVKRGLRAVDIPPDAIHMELFSQNVTAAKQLQEKYEARVKQHGSQNRTVTIIRDGRQAELQLSSDGGNILDAGLDAGLDLPFSCKNGVCATCKAHLVQGEVDMDLDHGLTADEKRNRKILTCQSHPISDDVIVDFDAV